MTLSMPPTTALLVEQLGQWMQSLEGENFEFKEAGRSFPFDDLCKYCCALANEGGGKLILGVTDLRPRVVVGTHTFPQIEETRRTLMDKIPLRIETVEIPHPNGRVLVFDVPPRPVGVPVKFQGIYYSRKADQLVPMSEERLRRVFSEAGHDFSADICRGADMEDLDDQAIEDFRRRWIEKSKNNGLTALSQEQLLRDIEVFSDDGVTYAALILFGTHAAMGKFLAQAEVVFEYRSSENAGPAQQRKEYRQGFFSFYEDLWSTINLRNDLQHYQSGLFILDIPTFAERSVREAVLNAVSHRDYQLGGNVFVRQYSRRLVIESPGGFPVGVTLNNVLDQQSPRNRRIADAFAKCGLVERSGQGMNLMFEQSISQGKLRPDFKGTDGYNVVLTLQGEVRAPRFVQFLEKIGNETLSNFDAHDFLILDLVHRGEPVPSEMQPRLRRLVEIGVVETVGRGKGTHYLLSRHFYNAVGEKGAYTRRRGLDRNMHKELLLKHLRENPDGSPPRELRQVLPQLSEKQVYTLLAELREEGRARLEGTRRWALWKVSKETKRPMGV